MGDTGSKIDSSTGMVLEWMGNSPAIISEWFLASTYPDKLNLAINLHWGSSVVFWVPNSAHKNARNPRAKYIFSLAMIKRCLRKLTSVEITHILVKHLDWACVCVCVPVDLACHYLLHNFHVSITGLAITCNLWIWTGSWVTLGEDTSVKPLILCNNKWPKCGFWVWVIWYCRNCPSLVQCCWLQQFSLQPILWDLLYAKDENKSILLHHKVPEVRSSIITSLMTRTLTNDLRKKTLRPWYI